MADLTATKGDTWPITVTITDSAGAAVDITGGKLYFTVKTKYSDADSDAVITMTQTSHDSPTNGISSFDVTSTSTINVNEGTYVFDLQLKDVTGQIFTVKRGTILVNSHATISVA